MKATRSWYQSVADCVCKTTFAKKDIYTQVHIIRLRRRLADVLQHPNGRAPGFFKSKRPSADADLVFGTGGVGSVSSIPSSQPPPDETRIKLIGLRGAGNRNQAVRKAACLSQPANPPTLNWTLRQRRQGRLWEMMTIRSHEIPPQPHPRVHFRSSQQRREPVLMQERKASQ